MAHVPQRGLLHGCEPLIVVGVIAVGLDGSLGRTSLLRRFGGRLKTNLGAFENKFWVRGEDVRILWPELRMALSLSRPSW